MSNEIKSMCETCKNCFKMEYTHPKHIRKLEENGGATMHVDICLVSMLHVEPHTTITVYCPHYDKKEEEKC